MLTGIQERIRLLRRDCGRPEDDVRFHADGATDLVASRRWLAALKRGRVFFYDTQEVAIGLAGIDWSGRHLRHQEWPAQLNRFFWLDHLARVHGAERDPDAARLARATIEDWMNQRDPYGAGHPIGAGDNTLNLSIRLGQPDRWGWWNAAAAFVGAAEFDDAFVGRMLESTRGQIDFLLANLSPGGNWRISHLTCILFCSLVLPGFESHAALAAHGLREAFYRQVGQDGAHCEHTPGYHGWMTNVGTMLWHLARARPALPLPRDAARVMRMWDYGLASATPDGGSAGLHDSGVWAAGDASGASLAAKRDAICAAAQADASAVWNREAEPSRWFPDAGQLFLRDGWGADATFVSFDATRWGGAHCHLSRLAVGLYAGGRMLLYDPGIFSYEGSDPFMCYGKSTPAHNTIAIDGWNQTPSDPERTAVHLLDDYAVATAAYRGGMFPGRYYWDYPKGPGAGLHASHQRWLLWLKGRALLVFDRVMVRSVEPRRVAAHWQLPAGPFRLDPGLPGGWTEGAGEQQVLVQCAWMSHPTRAMTYAGQEDPLLGWLPTDVHGGHVPAPMLAFETESDGRPMDLVTLIQPFRGAAPRPEIKVTRSAVGGGHALALRWDACREDHIAFMPGMELMAGTCGPLDTDGVLACVSLDDGQPGRAFVHEGFQLRWQGRALIDRAAGGTWEWRAG